MSREYPCVHHKDGWCRRNPKDVDACVFGPCTDETPSNGDRVRNMSDEELAEFLSKWAETHYAWQTDPGTTGWWLEQPEEESARKERFCVTRDEAIKILHPATSREALLPYAYDQARRLAVITEAMRMGAEALVENQALRNAANGFKTEANAADVRCEALEKKLAEAIEDMSGICYLCGKSKPFKMGDWVMRSCDYMAAKAANNMQGCVHFVWKGQEGEHGALD